MKLGVKSKWKITIDTIKQAREYFSSLAGVFDFKRTKPWQQLEDYLYCGAAEAVKKGF